MSTTEGCRYPEWKEWQLAGTGFLPLFRRPGGVRPTFLHMLPFLQPYRCANSPGTQVRPGAQRAKSAKCMQHSRVFNGQSWMLRQGAQACASSRTRSCARTAVDCHRWTCIMLHVPNLDFSTWSNADARNTRTRARTHGKAAAGPTRTEYATAVLAAEPQAASACPRGDLRTPPPPTSAADLCCQPCHCPSLPVTARHCCQLMV